MRYTIRLDIKHDKLVVTLIDEHENEISSDFISLDLLKEAIMKLSVEDEPLDFQ